MLRVVVFAMALLGGCIAAAGEETLDLGGVRTTVWSDADATGALMGWITPPR